MNSKIPVITLVNKQLWQAQVQLATSSVNLDKLSLNDAEGNIRRAKAALDKALDLIGTYKIAHGEDV